MSSSNDIRERARDWVAAGIIDAGQAERIGAYEATRDVAVPGAPPAAATSSRAGMQALFGVLGGLLVGLGVLLTVATNWAEIADPLKVAILVASMLVAYAAALVADARNAPDWAGSVAYLVGIGLFAAGIVIIGTVYNVRSHEPFAALLVALAATAIALLSQRMTVGWVAAAAWLVWLGTELGTALDDLAEERMASALVSSLVLLGIAAFAISLALEGVARRVGEGGASGWRVWLARTDVVTVPLRSSSLLGLLFVLTQAGFAWHWEFALGAEAPQLEQWLAFAGAIVAIAALARFARVDHRRALVASLAGAAVLTLGVAVVHEQLIAAIGASTLLGLGGIGLVLLGMVASRQDLFVWGIAWLAVLVISRYLDFVFSVELGGIGFIGAGLLLLLLAWLVGRSRRLWRRRAEVVG